MHTTFATAILRPISNLGVLFSFLFTMHSSGFGKKFRFKAHLSSFCGHNKPSTPSEKEKGVVSLKLYF